MSNLILIFRNVNDDTVVIGNVVRHRYEPPTRLLPPPGVENFDKECGNDPNVCSEYANDIFNYYKSREVRITQEGARHRRKPLGRSLGFKNSL